MERKWEFMHPVQTENISSSYRHCQDLLPPRRGLDASVDGEGTIHLWTFIVVRVGTS